MTIRDSIGKEAVFVSKSTTLHVGMKRFDKGPYFDFYHKESNLYGVYAERFYPISLGNNVEDMYWRLRRKAVMYDVPEKPIQIEGPDAGKFLDKVFSRKISTMKVGRGRYAIACNEDGGIFIDGVFFRLDENKYWYVQPDGPLETWLKAHQGNYDVKITDPSSRVIQVQGPASQKILSQLTNGSINDDFKYYHSGYFEIANQKVYISRTGWTAELGYEIYSLAGNTDYKKLWNTIIDVGAPLGLQLDGILSMEMRRIEGGILDNNTDFDSSMNPYEAGLGSLVDLDKDDFIGKKSLENFSLKNGKRLFGLISDKPLKYKSNIYLSDDKSIGFLPASTWSPTLKKFIAYVRFDYSDDWMNSKVRAETQDSDFVECDVVDLPFYDKDKLIPKGKDKTIP
ncbi:aminomethyltransferase family protein [Alphaproteobacteria bacterium]|nr:aminomethyltransferase family protein [Alphaproteobacteria bacterium]